MTATMTAPFATFADVIAGLGDVPLWRVAAWPAPGTATEADVIRHVEAVDRWLVELVDGTLVEKGMGWKRARLAIWLGGRLDRYCEEHDIGWVTAPDTMARMQGGNVRIPDVSVFPFTMFPDGTIPDEKVASVSPQLAVEILSDSNTLAEIAKKLREYFASGTTLAWVIDPEKRAAKVYTSATKFTTLDDAGALDGQGILPGFLCPLTDLFAAGDHLSPTRKKAP